MPSQNKTWITHTFGGGWATDWGPTYYGGVEGNRLVIPWLNNAANVVYEFDGGPRKAPGTTTLNSAIAGAPTLTGLIDYWRQGTAGTPAHRIVAYANDGNLYHDGGSGSFTSIGSGLQATAAPNFSLFNDLLIYGNDSTTDTPKSWDQSTYQTLAGSPPRFSFSVKHKNKLWAAGNYSAPSRLYFSVTGNPEDWTGAGNGSIDIDPGDGDMITGIASHKNELWVFKGPNKLSIHRITGSSSSDFARTTFIDGISAAWQSCIFPMGGDDLGFISPRGTIHSLEATDSFGDYNQAYISYPIQTWLRDNLNQNRHRYWQTVSDPLRGYTLITCSLQGVTNNTRILMMDWRFMAQGESYPRWSLWDFGSFASLAYCMDTNNQPRPFAGGYDGIVYKLDKSGRTHNNTSINFDVQTPYVTYGTEVDTKTIDYVSIGFNPRSVNTSTFGWSRDANAEQTETFTQNAGAVLGVFLLGTDTLGGGQFTQRFLELNTGGDFRSIKYRINENVDNSDIEVHNLCVALTSTGQSMENS